MNKSELEDYLEQCLNLKRDSKDKINVNIASAINEFAKSIRSDIKNFSVSQNGFESDFSSLDISNGITEFNLTHKLHVDDKVYTINIDLFAAMKPYLDGTEDFVISLGQINGSELTYDELRFTTQLRNALQEKIEKEILQ